MPRVPEITPDELSAMLALPTDQRPVLLDVRRPQEHSLVALPASLLIPLHELEDRADELKAFCGKKVVVYCHHGIRSLTGAQVLLDAGLDAVSLHGGIHLWARDIDPSMLRY